MSGIESLRADSIESESWDMANLRPRRTGLPMTIWVQEPSDATRQRHGPRIKVSLHHGERFDPDESVTVTLDAEPRLIGSGLAGDDWRKAREFVEANREPLLDLWNHRIDISDFLERMTPVE